MPDTVTRSRKGVVFREGDAAASMYLVKRGRVACLKASKDRLIPVYVAEEGDVLGENAMAEDGAYSYSAIALTEAELVGIPAENFRQVLADAPAWLEELSATMLGRFESTANLIAQNRLISPFIIDEAEFPSDFEVECKNLLSQNR